MRAEGDIANLIMQATIWRRIGIIGEPGAGVVLNGRAGDAETIQLQRFLLRNTYPHRIVETTQKDRRKPKIQKSTPSVVLSDGRTLHRPTIAQLADELGITELPDPHRIYDVAVVGAGPSGLAAAVYAASEGLCTIVIESIAPGRPGWHQLQNRKLPWLSDGDLRPAPRESRSVAGPEVWCAIRHLADRW